MKAVISRAFSRALTSTSRRDILRWCHDIGRRTTRRMAIVHYFHQDDDPYSKLLAACLPELQERYHIELHCHRVSPPDDASAPDSERLREWSARDAAALATAYRLNPDRALIDKLRWCTTDPKIGASLRKRLGHYLGATLYFEGEWYWGIDRLHYLEERLQSSGLARRTCTSALIEPLPLRCRCGGRPVARRFRSGRHLLPVAHQPRGGMGRILRSEPDRAANAGCQPRRPAVLFRASVVGHRYVRLRPVR